MSETRAARPSPMTRISVMMECSHKLLALLIVLDCVSQSWAFQPNIISSWHECHLRKGIATSIARLSNPGYARTISCSLRNQRRAHITEYSASAGGPTDTKRSSELIFSEYSQISGGEIQVHQMAQGVYLVQRKPCLFCPRKSPLRRS